MASSVMDELTRVAIEAASRILEFVSARLGP
jgi:hypothetical protein